MGNKTIVESLLAGNADVDNGGDGKDKNTPLMIATRAGHFSIVKMLINHKCDIFATNVDGLTAFSMAAICRNNTIATYIYTHLRYNNKYTMNRINNYINQKESKSGQTPYILACKSYCPQLIISLVEKCRVNATLVDNFGKYGSDYIDSSKSDLKEWCEFHEQRRESIQSLRLIIPKKNEKEYSNL